MKAVLKTAANKLLSYFGLKIYSVNAHGREDVHDIRRCGNDISVIFDVGANIGQSIVKFRSAFPEAKIYSFEPVQSVYEKLADRTKKIRNLELFKMALADLPGESRINIRKHDTTHTLAPADDAINTETAKIETVDRICDQRGIDRIGILKVDVEGFDLKVLEGAEKMLEAHKVDFVIVEAGFTKGDRRHVLFDNIRDFLDTYDFRLFGVYDQQLEWTGELRIRFANVCFARQN